MRVAAEWQRAFSWIERELGGKIVRAERQARWRPAWFLDLERDGTVVPLYFRGERREVENGAQALEHEMRVLQVLADHDVPVPRVYGLCPEPLGIVMERAPGRANLATARDASEREAVLDHYMEILARMHRIDLAAFEAVGLSVPTTPEARGLVGFDTWERNFRRGKRRPEPAIEFVIGWVRRHVPRDATRIAFVCCDSGQFLFDHGRVTAVIDLELACLGDPVADLGGLPGRDLSEPLGDLNRAVATYEACAGEPVDRGTIDFHTVRFSIMTPMAVAPIVASPPAGFDLVQYLAWYLVWTRGPLEVIAERAGIPLAPLPPLEGEDRDAVLEAPATGDFESYRSDAEDRLAIYRARRDAFGADCDAEFVEDVAQLLGGRPADVESADADLEALIRRAGPESEAELVPVLHRRVLREEAILRPVMRELAAASWQRIR